MQLAFYPTQLELKHTFTISRWSYTHAQSLIVEVKRDGFSGLGEATHNAYYPNTEIAEMQKSLEKVAPILANLPPLPPEQFYEKIAPALEDHSFARCALDVAYHDWYAKVHGQPLYAHWGLNPEQTPPNCYTISIDTIDTMIERMRSVPWPIYKIKLGTAQDIEMIEALRQHTDAPFWVDANCAWRVDEAIRKAKELSRLGVTLIEQPLPAEEWEAMREVYAKSPLPLLADESCKTLADIERIPGHFHGVNIKVMKAGGLTPARSMIRAARERHLKVMLGCMTESTVGISAIAHLSPLVDFADMDGQHFIKNDPAEGVRVTPEGFQFPARHGSGARLIATT